MRLERERQLDALDRARIQESERLRQVRENNLRRERGLPERPVRDAPAPDDAARALLEERRQQVLRQQEIEAERERLRAAAGR